AQIASIVEKTVENCKDRITFSTLKQLEAGDAFFVEHDNFSVQEQCVRPKAADRGGDTREPAGPILLVSRDQANTLSFLVGEHPVAIVLLLVIPARPVEGLGDEGSQHGFNPERYSILQGHTLAWQCSLCKLTLSPASSSAPRGRGRAPITLPGCCRVSFSGLLGVAAPILGDLGQQAVAYRRSGPFSSDVRCGCILIAMFYEQPCGSARVHTVAAGVDQDPGALQLAAMEREFQLSG